MEKTDQRLTISGGLLKKGLIGSFMLLSAFLAFAIKPAQAMIIISDEETEHFLEKTSKPFFQAAHIPFNRNKVFIVQDNSLNAFVGDGNNLFVHTGTIISSDNRNELEGVIAHEVGHIQGGHILRGKIAAQTLQQIGLASTILAGATAVLSGRGDMAMAVALGGQTSTLNQFANYRTGEERSADEAAVKLLAASNKSPAGMLEFMKKINQRNALNGIEELPYFRTHPVTRERITFLENATQQSSASKENPQDEEFVRVKAKLTGFLDTPAHTLKKYPYKDKTTAARYARTIAHFKQSKLQQALKDIDELISEEPKNPYFRELKGQIYLENGKVREAKQEYQKALDLLPNSELFKINWAQAAIEASPTRADLQKIVNLLNQANVKRPSSFAYMMLARAYEGLGNKAYADYAAAEYSLGIGATEIAKRQALNAKKAAVGNSKLTLKLDDLLSRIDQYDNKR